MNYYKRHLGDYAKDTKTISIYEHGVYTVVLDYYYSEEGPVSDEDVEALCRPQNAKEKLSVDKVMRRYFKRDGALWRHSYADRVIADWQEKSAKAAESADKRWHSERNANASAPVMPPQSEGNASHKPLAISQQPEREERARAVELADDWKPPDWVKVRLLTSGASQTWTPQIVGAYVAHYRAQSIVKTEKEWGELFVKWMLKEPSFSGGKIASPDADGGWAEFREATRAGRLPAAWKHPRTAAAIEALGGWAVLKNAESKALDFKEREFKAAFARAA